MSARKKTNGNRALDPPSASQEYTNSSNINPSDIGFSSSHRPIIHNYNDSNWDPGAFGMTPPSFTDHNEAAWDFHAKLHDIGQQTNGPFPIYPKPPTTPPSVVSR